MENIKNLKLLNSMKSIDFIKTNGIYVAAVYEKSFIVYQINEKKQSSVFKCKNNIIDINFYNNNILIIKTIFEYLIYDVFTEELIKTIVHDPLKYGQNSNFYIVGQKILSSCSHKDFEPNVCIYDIVDVSTGSIVTHSINKVEYNSKIKVISDQTALFYGHKYICEVDFINNLLLSYKTYEHILDCNESQSIIISEQSNTQSEDKYTSYDIIYVSKTNQVKKIDTYKLYTPSMQDKILHTQKLNRWVEYFQKHGKDEKSIREYENFINMHKADENRYPFLRTAFMDSDNKYIALVYKMGVKIYSIIDDEIVYSDMNIDELSDVSVYDNTMYISAGKNIYFHLLK